MSTEKIQPHRSSLGMDANVAAMISYLAAMVVLWIPHLTYLSWLVPLVFYFLEKESTYVKFHSMQSFTLQVVNFVLKIVVNFLFGRFMISVFFARPQFGGIWGVHAILVFIIAMISAVVSILITVFTIIAIVKSLGYEEYKIPLVGEWSVKLGKKFESFSEKK